MKKILFIIVFLFSASLLAVAYGMPILAMDGTQGNLLPKNFRTTANFKSLHAIGSGQFSISQLKYVIRRIKHPIIVIDLRQESHGFVNGLPVSWYGIKNWANKGKTINEIKKTEQSLLNGVKSRKSIIVCTNLKKTAEGIPPCSKPILLKVEKVQNERNVVESNGLQYYRFYVPDHSAPTIEQAKRFIRLINTIPAGSWVYFHCRAGEGRTTTFMVLYDIIKSAKNTSLKEILSREFRIGGKDLTNIAQGYKKAPALQRLTFIKNFYQFCRKNLVSKEHKIAPVGNKPSR